MKFIWVWDGRKVKQLTIIIIAAFFTAGLLYVERNQLMVFSTSDGPQAFYRADIDEKKVALTFNISWGDKKAIPILDVLKDKKISSATFFVSAAWAERHPDTVERIIADGHELGNHGYQYKNYPSWDDNQIRKDLRQSHEILSQIAEEKPNLLRPPNGHFDKRVLNIALSHSYTVVHWSVDSKDYENPGVEAIVNNVVSHTNPGDVLLLHASDSVKQTDKALPIIINQLRKKGYSFVTTSELIKSTHSENEEIK